MVEAVKKRVERLQDPESSWCSFCGKERSEVKQLFSGPVEELYICDECVSKCYHMLKHK
ncbi:MAG: ClpX C4-type zinc finger protein [Candidatus Thiodiazotropha sp.]